jgi:hypothetical protein
MPGMDCLDNRRGVVIDGLATAPLFMGLSGHSTVMAGETRGGIGDVQDNR